MSDYKPTGSSSYPPALVSPSTFTNPIPEHDGLRQDGQPDKRVGTGGKNLHIPSTKYNKVLTSSSEFAGGKVDPVEAGKKGGVTGGETGGSSSGGDSSSSGGSGNGQFAGGKVDPVEAGRKGGQSSH